MSTPDKTPTTIEVLQNELNIARDTIQNQYRAFHVSQDQLKRQTTLAENRKKAIKSLIRSYDKQGAKLLRQSILQSAFNRANERANRFEEDLRIESLELEKGRDLHRKSLDEINDFKREIKELRENISHGR